MDRAELAGWLRLTLTPGVGDLGARRLLAAFGLPQTVFEQPVDALRQVVGPAAAEALQRLPEGFEPQLDRSCEWLAQREPDGAVRRVVTLADSHYPAALLQIPDPPPLLYLLGAPAFADAPADAPGVAVVGSRNPTPQGAVNARSFARALAEAGWTVVSGLALGVDGAAHEGALDAPGNAGRCATIAVVGTGLDRVYPVRHRALAHRIAAQGLIVSEFPLGTPPLTPNFPRRNRLIAGLSRGTLVVEAALPSGSLITARLAAEQGREVFAIPGSIHAPQSRGCHALIRQGAKLVETVHDILEELGATTAHTAAAAPAPCSDESALLAALGFDPVGLDALAARTREDAASLQAQLLALELEGRLARLPGGLFQRLT